ncbi:hypothetical protein ACS0PU_008092 [Formica fusca]
MFILSGPSNATRYKKFICLSEDDGTLIWLKNSNRDYEIDEPIYSLNGYNNSKIDCKMNADEKCLKSWSKENWSFTNSLQTPMGPVFDQRWKGFKEYVTKHLDTYERIDVSAMILNNTTTTITFSVSIFTLIDWEILFCYGTDYNRDYCYLLKQRRGMFMIDKCDTQVSVPEDLKCTSSPLQGAEDIGFNMWGNTMWKTFIISWNSITRKMSIYNSDDDAVVTYEDTEKPEHLVSKYNIFVYKHNMERFLLPIFRLEYIPEPLFRFHIYDFLHTTLENAILTSPIVEFDNETICVDILLGLCAECDAHIRLLDSANYEILETIIATGSSKTAKHGLPMWQYVQIKKNLTTSYNNVIIQLVPILNMPTCSPLWAIANVRQCPRNGTLKSVALYIKLKEWERKLEGILMLTMSMACQKLFYGGSTIISTSFNPEIEHSDCPQGKIGPQCLISCEHDLQSNTECENVTVCNNNNGCSCPFGFVGYSCSLPIKRPNIPTVTSVSNTSIDVTVSVTWDYNDKYRYIPIFYSFEINKQLSYDVQQSRERIFQNTTHLIRQFGNLKPNTAYEIRCNLKAPGYKLHSDWINVRTDCNLAESFDIYFEKPSIIIDWQKNASQSYLCPANWYQLVVQDIDTNEQVINQSIIHFPHKLSHLPLYTSFNVFIFHKDHQLFSQEIRTYKNVLNLQKMFSSNTVILFWKPSNQSNEEIVQYRVLLKVKEYRGCKDLNLTTSDNHIIIKHTTNTTISFSNLHPYASYIAQVTANNLQHDSEIIFNTNNSEIPSETFSHLKVEKWKLTWDPPENCTTISGSLMARIIIRGISGSVKDYYITKETSHNFLDLHEIEPILYSHTRYVATIYVIRNYSSPENTSAYQEYHFTTPIRVIPKVNNLEIVEIDTRQIPAVIHLRWESLLPSLYADRYYMIVYCIEDNTYSNNYYYHLVQLNEFCELWDNYICYTISKPIKRCYYDNKIQVFITDDKFTPSSEFRSDSLLMDEETFNNITPDAPANYTCTINNNSVVDLKWHHPWKTGGHLQFFRIQIIEIFSNLTMRSKRLASQSPDNDIYTYEYPVTHYMRNYSKRLYLFPSTQYLIYIQAVTIANESSKFKYVRIQTPSTIAFDGDLKVMDKSISTISLNIPPILNDTYDSRMHIIVKGSTPCEQHSEVPKSLQPHAGMKGCDVKYAWHAAEVSINEFAGKIFTVGDNKIYGGVRNCPLKCDELYKIVIIVTEQNASSEPLVLVTSIRTKENDEVPSKHYEA